jgi:hypothetical protein
MRLDSGFALSARPEMTCQHFSSSVSGPNGSAHRHLLAGEIIAPMRRHSAGHTGAFTTMASDYNYQLNLERFVIIKD